MKATNTNELLSYTQGQSEEFIIIITTDHFTLCRTCVRGVKMTMGRAKIPRLVLLWLLSVGEIWLLQHNLFEPSTLASSTKSERNNKTFSIIATADPRLWSQAVNIHLLLYECQHPYPEVSLRYASSPVCWQV